MITQPMALTWTMAPNQRLPRAIVIVELTPVDNKIAGLSISVRSVPKASASMRIRCPSVPLMTASVRLPLSLTRK